MNRRLKRRDRKRPPSDTRGSAADLAAACCHDCGGPLTEPAEHCEKPSILGPTMTVPLCPRCSATWQYNGFVSSVIVAGFVILVLLIFAHAVVDGVRGGP
jgi:hypothetical protein